MAKKTYTSDHLFVLVSWWEHSGVSVDLETVFTDEVQAQEAAGLYNSQYKGATQNNKRVWSLGDAISELINQAKA